MLLPRCVRPKCKNIQGKKAIIFMPLLNQWCVCRTPLNQMFSIKVKNLSTLSKRTLQILIKIIIVLTGTSFLPFKKLKDIGVNFLYLSFAFASYFPPLQGINLLFFTLFILLPSFFLIPSWFMPIIPYFPCFVRFFHRQKNDTFRHFFEKVSFL